LEHEQQTINELQSPAHIFDFHNLHIHQLLEASQ
jgi:hypothetical protein